MARIKLDQSLISEEIEGLNTRNLKKAFQRYKNDTSYFKRKNVRDPIDHLDFELNLNNELKEIKHRLENGDYHPKRPLIHYSPKKLGISRPTVSLHIEDVVVYRFIIEQFDEELIKITRQKNVRGGVMASPVTPNEDGDYYENWFEDWLKHNEALKKALGKTRYLATSDISSYFDNVDIDVLIDMLRESVKDKKNLISLLSFFLHGVKLRYTYATKLHTGLIQDDSNSSRILAYFFLHPHDIRMNNFTKEVKGSFFRFVDDMSVVVSSKVEAMKALKELTDSLRKQGLLASVDKTKILTSGEAILEMKYKENQEILIIENEMTKRFIDGKQTRLFGIKLKTLYEKFKKEGYVIESTWIKLLRRFYTLATKLKSDFLLDDIHTHLREHPSLITDRKLQRYFVINQDSSKFDKAINEIIDYLESEENLYPQAETELLELLNSIDLKKVNFSTQIRIQVLAESMIPLGKTKYKMTMSEYAQGMAVFLAYKSDSKLNTPIADIYLGKSVKSEYTRKCLAMVGLTCKDSNKRHQVIEKLRSETSIELKRLLYLIANVKQLRKRKVMKRFRNDTKFLIWKETWVDDTGEKKKRATYINYMPIRVRIVRDILIVNR